MSGCIVKLENELMLLVDELSHAIQKMLQIENFDGPLGLSLDEYKLEPNATLEETGDIDDSMSHVGDPTPLYSKKTLYAFSEGEQDDRKL